MKKRRKSWEYQKGRYKQLNLKFDMKNTDDALLYHFATNCTGSTTALIKKLLQEEMVRCAYEEV